MHQSQGSSAAAMIQGYSTNMTAYHSTSRGRHRQKTRELGRVFNVGSMAFYERVSSTSLGHTEVVNQATCTLLAVEHLPKRAYPAIQSFKTEMSCLGNFCLYLRAACMNAHAAKLLQPLFGTLPSLRPENLGCLAQYVSFLYVCA